MCEMYVCGYSTVSESEWSGSEGTGGVDYV